MKVIFRFQDVLEIMIDGFLELNENDIKMQRTTHCEIRKKDAKGIFLIH